MAELRLTQHIPPNQRCNCINPNIGRSRLFQRILDLFFALEHMIVGVLLQKKEQNLKQPIRFMSKSIRELELNYL